MCFTPQEDTIDWLPRFSLAKSLVRCTNKIYIIHQESVPILELTEKHIQRQIALNAYKHQKTVVTSHDLSFQTSFRGTFGPTLSGLCVGVSQSFKQLQQSVLLGMSSGTYFDKFFNWCVY